MSDPKALIGQRIEQYEIREHIARGGMADVYLAYEVELQRKVALKDNAAGAGGRPTICRSFPT